MVKDKLGTLDCVKKELPEVRYARITIRNPNKRMVKIEICGDLVELEAGESADLCLTDEAR